MSNGMPIERLVEARGATVYDSAGEKIGAVEEIFYDEQTNRPEWIGIGTGFFGTKRVLVPTAGAEIRDDGVYVRYSKAQVKDSPDIDSDEIGQDTEAALYSHYGLGYSERRSETGLPEGTPDATTGERAVTRSEEELAVGKREVEAGRVRLRKWVETEPVQADVELRRETAHVRREPIEEPISSTELGDEQVEVSLSAEEPVVEKRAVAKERITVDTGVETTEETISEELRKERVDVEGDAEER